MTALSLYADYKRWASGQPLARAGKQVSGVGDGGEVDLLARRLWRGFRRWTVLNGFDQHGEAVRIADRHDGHHHLDDSADAEGLGGDYAEFDAWLRHRVSPFDAASLYADFRAWCEAKP